jgi:predicted aspartyl protease
VLITDELRRIGTALGAPLGGGIGHSFLSRYRLTVDYAELAITLATPDDPVDPALARAELPFTLAHPSKPLILVPVTVEGAPFQFALDTGASTTVVSPALARLSALEGRAAPSMTGGGGTVAAVAGVIPMLAIGGVRLARVRAMVASFLDDIAAATGARIDGIIGGNVLRRFRVTIDYPRALLRLE